MPENTNFIGFGQFLTVELPPNLGSPVFISFEDQELYRRTVRLNQIEESNDAPPISGWNGRQVWIVSHGWNSNYDGYGRDLGLSIKQAKPQDIVLAIDWENAARTTVVGDPNTSPELISNINDGLGLVAVGAPFYAATWIGVVADVIAQQLAAWGVRNEAINLVGHSLGTLLNNEIAYRLVNTYASQTGGGKVKSITALEPPSEIPPARPIDERFVNGYVYLRETTPGIFQYVDPEDLQYKNLAEFSRAFLGRASIAGNTDFASQADESIIVDYASIDPQQHNWVHLTFQRLFTGERKLARGLLNLDDYRPHEDFQEDAFAVNFKSFFEGILLATSSSEILGFLAKAVSDSGFDRIVYGTDGADQIDLYQIDGQFVDDGEGGLPIFGNGDLSGNNLFYLGEGDDNIDLSGGAGSGNDRIWGEAGNDRINAGDGDDELHGGAGNDILAGEEGTDTAFFTGNLADYEWIDLATDDETDETNAIALRDKRSNSANSPNDGEDSLFNIEFAQFADVRIPLDAGIKNGKFEDALNHWIFEGDAQAIDQFQSIAPLQGQKMAFISTAVSVSSISQSFFVPAYAQGLAFTYRVISDEPFEYVDTEYDDQFEVLLDSVQAPSQSVSIAKETINTSSWQPIGVILPEGDDTAYHTGTRSVLFDLTPYRGQTVNLTFKVFDRGDAIYDTAVLIDSVSITVADIASPRLLNGTAGDDTLSGGIGHDTINAEGGNDTISGQTGNDELNGGDGNDTLYGGQDDDSLNGGSGIDWLVGDAGNDQLIIEDSGEGDVLSGGQGNDYYLVNFANQFAIVEKTGQGNDTIGTLVDMDLNQIQDSQGYMPEVENLMVAHPLSSSVVLRGNPLNNLITASNGHDTLDGDIGDDTLIGGAGNDTYIVDSVNDIVVEEANGGNDTIRASCNYSLMDIAEVENLVLIDYSFDGIGNTLNNTITGNARNNLLSGAAGNDHLDGRVGADTLNGGVGSDLLVGGIGDDIYVVDSTSDTVVENANEGTDIVQSSVTFTLTSLTSVENLTLTGSNAINGTGNALNNVLKGNAQANILTGNSGSDTLEGLGGSDTLRGGGGDDIYIVDSTSDLIQENANEGNDTVRSSMTFTLANLANVENLVLTGNSAINGTGNDLNNALTGNAQANRLTGGNGNDAISGNAGNDTLIGGTGNDLYIVDSTTDTIVENAAEGTDTVRSSVTFSLAALTNVENLTLIDTASNGTGNTLNNTLRGNTQNNTLNSGSGNDILEGNEGNDSLIGGSESDTLTGGLGNDSLTGNDGTDFFVLNAPGQGIDTIADFQVGQDKMRVSAAAFGGGLISGTTITANQFRAAAGATTATSAEHRFIYNSTTGALFYDADGNRTGFGTVQIATLTTKPLLSHSDIVVIA